MSSGLESLVKSAAGGAGLGTAGAFGLTFAIAAATIAIGTATIDTAAEDKAKGDFIARPGCWNRAMRLPRTTLRLADRRSGARRC